MRQLNKVILLGRLLESPSSSQLRIGKPIEIETRMGKRYKFPTPPQLEDGTSLAFFRLNSKRSYIASSDERRVIECDIDVLAFGGTAEMSCQYLYNGMQALVEGRLAYHEWKDETGEPRSKHCLIARSVQPLDRADAPESQRGGSQALVPEFNNVVLLGNLTKNPSLHDVGGGRRMTLLRMASTREYNTPFGGREPAVCFINVEVWNRSAELCYKYLGKGRQILVEGSLQRWRGSARRQNKDGLPRHRINARAVQFFGSSRSKQVRHVAEESDAEIYFVTENGGEREAYFAAPPQNAPDDIPKV